MKRCVCFWDARQLGRQLREHPLILDVEVYGSIARDGIGNDLDLILVVDDAVALSFIERVRADKDTRFLGIFKRGFGGAQRRAARALLGDDFGRLIFAAACRGMRVDVVLFPLGWRSRTSELDRLLDNRPTFMQQVCRDAVTL